MTLLLFHLEITSYIIQMEAQGGTMDVVNANTLYIYSVLACSLGLK